MSTLPLNVRATVIASMLSFVVGTAQALAASGETETVDGATSVEPAEIVEPVASSRSFGPSYYSWGPMGLLSNNGKGYDISDMLLGEGSPYDFGGWVQFGYSNESTGLFNSNPDDFNNNQTWLYLERTADGSDGFDWGGRFDAMYGVDAQDTQSFGNNPGRWDFDNGFDQGIYGWALPQLYVDLAYKDVSVRAGHFYTLVGYEVVPAPGNFFFSHAFTQYLSEPFTHTGFVATYSGFENVTFYGGWTAGWDTGFDQFGDGNSFLGGFSATPIEQVVFTYIVTAGDLGAIGSGYSHSMVLDTTPFDRLNYVLQSDLVTTDEDVLGSGNSDYDTIGINQYLIYWLLDEVGIGTRFEWWKANGTSYYGITGGVNLQVLPNLTVRPEGRYQWSPAGNGSSGITSRSNPAGLPLDEGGIFSIDMILTF